jgi:hypothetical protein
MEDRSKVGEAEEKNLIPSTQVDDPYREFARGLLAGLDEAGRETVRDFILGRPYRAPSTIQSDLEVRKSTSI